jgi:hypothetical protein
VGTFRGRLRWICCALASVLCGCSAIVDPGSFLVRCEVGSDGSDPCAAIGLSCTSGTCQQCKPEPELCDGHDNDCDHKVDEGFDADGDGFTWCGGGHPELVDCAPDDPTIHPPAINPDGTVGAAPHEDCDGKDNDCDGKIDEDPSCAPLRTCVQTGCPQALTCDTQSNQCVASQPSGSSCKSDAECGAGFCISTSALGLSNVLADKLCGTACCKDADCPTGRVCTQSGSGARVCLPTDIAGRQRGQDGDQCMRSSDCRSGVCQRGRCIATCSRDADCSGETCRLNVLSSSLLSGAGAFVCGTAAGRGNPGDLCTAFDPTSCKSALCLDALQCGAPCGSNADCEGGMVCRYVSVQGLLGGGRVTACVPPDTQSTGPAQSTCCTSTDCHTGEACRPMQGGAGQGSQGSKEWGMYCMPQSGVQ